MPDHELEPLTFILGDSKSHAAQEAIRVHVMRRQHRQRRLQRQRQDGKRSIVLGQAETYATAAVLSTPTAESSAVPAVAESDDRLAIYTWTPPQACEVFTSKRSFAESIQLPNFPELAENFQYHLPPTGGCPMRSAEHALVQYYMESMGYSSLSIRLARTYSKTIATYSTFLAIVATRIVEEKGIAPPIDPAELENLAIREVAAQLTETPTIADTSTMLAVALFAHLRESQGEQEKARMHWDALRRIVAINGGPESLRQADDLYPIIFWMEGIVLSRVPCSIGQTCDDFEAVLNPTAEVLRFFEDINGAMTSFHTTGGNPTHKLTKPISQTLSRPVLKAELSSLNDWQQARLACLVYFATVALTSRKAVQMTSIYAAIEAEVLQRGSTYTVRPEELYYILLERDRQSETLVLAPKVARLVNAIKRFDHQEKHTCCSILSAYLGFGDP